MSRVVMCDRCSAIVRANNAYAIDMLYVGIHGKVAPICDGHLCKECSKLATTEDAGMEVVVSVPRINEKEVANG